MLKQNHKIIATLLPKEPTEAPKINLKKRYRRRIQDYNKTSGEVKNKGGKKKTGIFGEQRNVEKYSSFVLHI